MRQADDHHGLARASADEPRAGVAAAGEVARRGTGRALTTFVESCVGTVAGSAVAAEKQSRGRPKIRRLLHLLKGKKNLLVTTHLHPDPDALASTTALTHLLRQVLPHAKVTLSIKGQFGGGINSAFARLSELDIAPWDEAGLEQFDAILLLDTQPQSAFSPLPKSIEPAAVIDHHRGKARNPHCPFCDIRTDVGATSSIIFSYFMELEMEISPTLAASLLFAIESDLAGAAGTPGELDNVALSSLVLLADTNRLYQMRYVRLPQSYYAAYDTVMRNAVLYGPVIVSHLDKLESLERPAVMGDFLLRLDGAHWVMVTAVYENKLVMSLRTSDRRGNAADVARRVMRKIGEGGGHRTKAGGYVLLSDDAATEKEIAGIREVLCRRFLRLCGVTRASGARLLGDAAKT